MDFEAFFDKAGNCNTPNLPHSSSILPRSRVGQIINCTPDFWVRIQDLMFMVVTTGHWPPYLLPPISEDNSLLHRHFNNFSVCVFSSSWRGDWIGLDNWTNDWVKFNKTTNPERMQLFVKCLKLKTVSNIAKLFGKCSTGLRKLLHFSEFVSHGWSSCAAVHLKWMKGHSTESKQKTKYLLQKLRKSIYSMSPALS